MMPGILPMKVIKVGTSTQTRIAQACDRCRSKKIRCDGLAPTCTQCKSVGFECKTSDKLSRRAFPRGYTESLEDRVRALESEVRDLKDLLDEKDEKIEMLSKFHSQSSMIMRKTSLTPPSDNELPKRPSIESPKEETFKIHQPPFLSGEGEDAFFIGSSSGRALIDAFKRKLLESGNPFGSLNTAAFFAPYERSRSWLVTGSQQIDAATAPPRLLSDQLINVFFQEWAPLFPILHRPTFLSQYEQYVSNTNNITDRRVLTQLNLVFGIAALSQTGQLRSSVEQYEKRWHAAMENCYLETSVASLQCLILALVHAMLSANPTKLLHFRSRAVGMSQRLGLHLSQKRFPLGALTTETRKRIFWTLYTLDCFAAATFGLPRLIQEADVECEYPVDADDEFVTEEGFMPTVPGSCTKLSSALALFRCSRVLAKVLEENYPANASYELSLSKVAALDAELEAWQETLAPHLRMEFVADKPSTNIVSSRSPLLALTYHYIRTLIHRPAACGPLGEKAYASVVALASSSKRIVQLVQLLDERRLNFSHCMNKDEILIVSGVGLLFQAMDLERDGKFMKDVTRMVYTVADMLDQRHAPGAQEFRTVSASILPKVSPPSPIQSSRSPSTSASSVARDVSVQTQRQLQALAAKSSVAKSPHNQHLTAAQDIRQQSSQSPHHERRKQQSKSATPALKVASTKMSPPSVLSRSSSESNTKAVLKQALQQIAPAPAPAPRNTNLDFLPLYSSGDRRRMPPPPSSSTTPGPERRSEVTVWDSIIETMNAGKPEVPDYYDSTSLGEVYPTPGAYLQAPQVMHGAATPFQPDVWSYNMEHMNPHVDHNSLGFSEESLTATEDFSSIDASSNDTTSEVAAFGGLMAPPPHMHHDHAYNLLDPLNSQLMGGGVQYW